MSLSLAHIYPLRRLYPQKFLDTYFYSRIPLLVIHVNKLLHLAHENPVHLLLRTLGLSSIHIIFYSDASFENKSYNWTIRDSSYSSYTYSNEPTQRT